METLKIYEVIPEHKDLKYILNIDVEKARSDFDYYFSEDGLSLKYEFKIVHEFCSEEDIVGLELYHENYGRYKTFDISNFCYNYPNSYNLEEIKFDFSKERNLREFKNRIEKKYISAKNKIDMLNRNIDKYEKILEMLNKLS